MLAGYRRDTEPKEMQRDDDRTAIQPQGKPWAREKVYAITTAVMMSHISRSARTDRGNGETMELGNKCANIVLDSLIEDLSVS